MLRYVSAWMDSLMPGLFYFTGSWDEGAQTLNMTGEGPNPMGPGAAKYRTAEKSIDNNHRELDMFITGPDGTEMKMFHYEYERT